MKSSNSSKLVSYLFHQTKRSKSLPSCRRPTNRGIRAVHLFLSKRSLRRPARKTGCANCEQNQKRSNKAGCELTVPKHAEIMQLFVCFFLQLAYYNIMLRKSLIAPKQDRSRKSKEKIISGAERIFAEKDFTAPGLMKSLNSQMSIKKEFMLILDQNINCIARCFYPVIPNTTDEDTVFVAQAIRELISKM